MFDIAANPWIIWVFVGVGSLLVILGIILFIIGKRKSNKIEVTETPKNNVNLSSNEWVDALGNVDNITLVEAKGSRLIVNLGATNIIMSKDKVTIILKDNAQKIRDLLK